MLVALALRLLHHVLRFNTPNPGEIRDIPSPPLGGGRYIPYITRGWVVSHSVAHFRTLISRLESRFNISTAIQGLNLTLGLACGIILVAAGVSAATPPTGPSGPEGVREGLHSPGAWAGTPPLTERPCTARQSCDRPSIQTLNATGARPFGRGWAMSVQSSGESRHRRANQTGIPPQRPGIFQTGRAAHLPHTAPEAMVAAPCGAGPNPSEIPGRPARQDPHQDHEAGPGRPEPSDLDLGDVTRRFLASRGVLPSRTAISSRLGDKTMNPAESRQDLRKQMPERYQSVYDRSERPRHYRDAITAFCVMCVGFTNAPNEIRACTDPACPLWHHRPHKPGEQDNDCEEPVEGSIEECSSPENGRRDRAART
jgi:hypothetical protein